MSEYPLCSAVTGQGMRAANGLRGSFRHAKVLDLCPGNEVFYGSGYVFDGNVGVHAVPERRGLWRSSAVLLSEPSTPSDVVGPAAEADIRGRAFKLELESRILSLSLPGRRRDASVAD